MKIPFLKLLCIAGLATSTSQAAVVFNETFENTPPYGNNMNLNGTPPTGVEGLGVINYGAWGTTSGPSGNASWTSTINQAYSGSRSMAATIGNATGSVSIVGLYGANNTAVTTVTSELQVKFAIRLDDVSDITTSPYVGIRNTIGENLALVYIQDEGGLRVNNTTPTFSITADTWYQFEFLMPANPTLITNQYTFNVYNASNSLVYTTTQNLNAAPTSGHNNYSFTVWNIQDLSNTMWLDNVTANAVPEPAVAVLVLGAIAAFGLRRRARNPLTSMQP